MTIVGARPWPVIHSSNSQAVARVRRKLTQFEVVYEMTTDEMAAAVAADRMRETAEVADWLFWRNSLRSLTSPRGRSEI